MSDVSGIVTGISDIVIGTREPDFQGSEVAESHSEGSEISESHSEGSEISKGEMPGSDCSYHSENEVLADIGEQIDIPTGLGECFYTFKLYLTNPIAIRL